MTVKSKMSIKEFWLSVEDRLKEFSAEELRGILRSMAHRCAPRDRHEFLDHLKPPAVAQPADQAIHEEELLADIDDLAAEFRSAIDRSEPPYEYGWRDYGDDDDTLGTYEEFVGPIADLFDRTDGAFDGGKLQLARLGYQRLFELLCLEDEYGRGVRASDLSDVAIDEAMARYLRAVYETEPPVNRPRVLFEQFRQATQWIARPVPSLQAVVQVLAKPLRDLAQFLEAWIGKLRRESGQDADAWLREAVGMYQGNFRRNSEQRRSKWRRLLGEACRQAHLGPGGIQTDRHGKQDPDG